MLVRLTRDLMAQYKSVLINYTTDSVPSVLWRCWLGGRKGIRPVKNWVVGCWRGYLSGARCRLAYGPADATAMPKMTRLVVPFLYRLKRVVLDKGPLNGCVCIYDRLLTDWRYGDSAGNTTEENSSIFFLIRMAGCCQQGQVGSETCCNKILQFLTTGGAS